MFKSTKQFLNLWAYESGATARLMASLTDASLGQLIAPGHRTLGQVCWHIAGSVGGIMRQAGLAFDAPNDRRERAPGRAAEILAGYRRAADGLAGAIREQWTDETLLVKDTLYGNEWPRGFTLQVMLFHEIHHRGQATVLMRQAGLAVPGVYGPSQDDRKKEKT
jgi:uncharacterized damage-inducible protein DinB